MKKNVLFFSVILIKYYLGRFKNIVSINYLLTLPHHVFINFYLFMLLVIILKYTHILAINFLVKTIQKYLEINKNLYKTKNKRKVTLANFSKKTTCS